MILNAGQGEGGGVYVSSVSSDEVVDLHAVFEVFGSLVFEEAWGCAA